MADTFSRNPIRKIVAGMAMVLAPLLFLAGAVIAPALDSDAGPQIANVADSRDRWFIAMVLFLLGWVAFVPAVLGLMHMLRERAEAYGLIGGALALLGTLASVGYVAIGFVIWQMAAPGADAGQMAALLDRVSDTTGTFIPFFLMGFSVTAGALVLAIGLIRSHTAAWWMAASIALGAVAFALGMALYSMPVLIVAAAFTLLGLGSLGILVLRESLEDWEHTPEFHGMRPLGAH